MKSPSARVLRVLADLIALEARGHSRAKALADMKTRAGSFDPRVLESISVCFDVFVPESGKVGGAVAEVSLKELRVGHLLADKIETRDGVLIVGAGTRITPMLLEKLRNFAAVNGIREPIQVESQLQAAAA